MRQMRFAVVTVGVFLGLSFLQMSFTIATADELRPSQKIMQARAGWMKSIGENLASQNFDGAKIDAEALAGQTKGAAEKQTVPLAKELTLKVSSLATALAGAAEKKDAATASTKLGEIKAVCTECHTNFRDKK